MPIIAFRTAPLTMLLAGRQTFYLLLIFTAVALLSATAVARDNGTPMPQAPSVPLTTEENWVVKRYTIHTRATVYDTWTARRRKVATLPPGSSIAGLGKLSVVYRPDVIEITAPIPELQVKTGDTILRYTEQGEGFADFWIKGRWYKQMDGSFITEPDTNGCSKNCRGKVSELGSKEWWAHIRLADGRTAWLRIER